ncbi:MAG: ISNCY family transposase [Cytophagales bacterium]|nr:ISNCY family transposase [Cytophagales bacterium]
MKFLQTQSDWESGRLTQEEAAQILGICERSFRRYLVKYDEGGLDALADRRLNQPSRRKAPLEERVKLADMYKHSFSSYNVRHFHQIYAERGGLNGQVRSYSWIKSVLQDQQLVKVAKARGKHRIKRERKPLPGMMIHQDASTHRWVPDEVWDLVVTLDDATSEHLDMRFVPQEGTASSMAGIKAVLQTKGIPSSFYSDRGAHYWTTPEAGGKVDKVNLTQFGQAMKRLGVEMIAAYSPEARGRSERQFKTHQGRLPQELASAGITTMQAANRYLKEHYMPTFNKHFSCPAAQLGTAYVPLRGVDVDEVLSERYERTVGNDNCVSYNKLKLQIPADQHRYHYVRTKVQVRVNCEGAISLYHGPRLLANYDEQGRLIEPERGNGTTG